MICCFVAAFDVHGVLLACFFVLFGFLIPRLLRYLLYLAGGRGEGNWKWNWERASEHACKASQGSEVPTYLGT